MNRLFFAVAFLLLVPTLAIEPTTLINKIRSASPDNSDTGPKGALNHERI